MYKKILLAIAVAFTFIASQNVLADSVGCGNGLKKMMESLQLDAAQKEKIKPIMDQLKSSLQGNASQMKDLHMQINQQLQSETMDQSTLDGLVDTKAKLIGNMMKAKMMAQHQVFMILTAPQKARLHSMMQTMEAKMAEKWKKCDAQNGE